MQSNNTSIKISAVIITFNEAKNIARCIDSLQGVADEIVVVDSFSTDSTINICKQKNVVVVQREWKGYSEAKNLGNRTATHDFILSVDADEALDEKLTQSILKEKESPRCKAYTMNRMTNYCGKWIKHCDWYPDVKLRLWDKKIGSWEGEIHEKIELEPNTKISHLKGDLLHYAIDSIQDHIKRVINFSEIAANDDHIKGKKASLVLHIIINPFTTFLNKYFLKAGFLDGYYGFVICILSGFSNFLKYTKLRELNKKHV